MLVHNYEKPLTRAEQEMINELRNGNDIEVNTVEEARRLLANMPELDAPSLGKMNPTFPDPKGTYRGDLINKSDPSLPVHDISKVIQHPMHSKYPHYNIYFPNGKKSAILIIG